MIILKARGICKVAINVYDSSLSGVVFTISRLARIKFVERKVIWRYV